MRGWGIQGVADQEPGGLVGEPAEIRLHISRLIPLIEVERVPAAHGVGREEVGGGDVRQERPRLRAGNGSRRSSSAARRCSPPCAPSISSITLKAEPVSTSIAC